MGDWLGICNVADVVLFIEAFRKMAGQYYPDKIDVCKDAVSIRGISMAYVLNMSLKKKILGYIHQGAFAINVKVHVKNSSIVVVMVTLNVVLIVKNIS